MGDWGAWAGEDLKEKIHAHMGQVHEHLKHLDEGEDDGVEVEGEATIEIIIQTDDGPPRHIKKRIPIDGKGYKMLWLGDDEKGEGDEQVLGLDLSGGHRFSFGGLHPLVLGGGQGLMIGRDDEGQRKVHVLELKELLERARGRRRRATTNTCSSSTSCSKASSSPTRSSRSSSPRMAPPC